MTLLKDNNYKDINVALLSLEADIKNKITSFDTSEIDKQLAEINSRIDKINAGGGSSSSDEIEDINSKLNSNSIKIRNIEQNIGDIDTQINGIEQKLSDIFSAESKVTDFNTTTNSGIYYWVTDAANRPTDYGVLLVNKYDNGGANATGLWVNQIAYGTNNKIYFRQNINSTGWTEWKAVVFEGGINAVPAYGTTDAGKALIVNGNGTGTEWHRLIKYHSIDCGTVTIPSRGWIELNSHLNDNEVPISAVVYRWASNTGAFYVTAYAGNPKLFYIVGTPGVVITELSVRIYCVDKVVLDG